MIYRILQFRISLDCLCRGWHSAGDTELKLVELGIQSESLVFQASVQISVIFLFVCFVLIL